MCSFECIGLQFKAIFRRFAGGKSREINAEMQFEVPKMHVRDFIDTLYAYRISQNSIKNGGVSCCFSGIVML